MKKEKFTVNELQERLRQNNIFNIGDVEYAILETSGQVTVIQKPEKRNTIPEDFGILPEYEGIPYDLVVDGKVMHENLKAIGRDYNWLKKQVEKFKIKPEQALIVTFDGKGQIFCQAKGGEKMKEIIIIISILIIIFTGSIVTQKYLNRTSDLLVDDLEDIKNDLEKNNLDSEKLAKKSEDMYKKWEEINAKWSIIILHDEIDLIETSLTKMKAEIKSGEIKDVMAELDTSIFLINHIKEKEKTSLKNIF